MGSSFSMEDSQRGVNGNRWIGEREEDVGWTSGHFLGASVLESPTLAEEEVEVLRRTQQGRPGDLWCQFPVQPRTHQASSSSPQPPSLPGIHSK